MEKKIQEQETPQKQAVEQEQAAEEEGDFIKHFLLFLNIFKNYLQKMKEIYYITFITIFK